MMTGMMNSLRRERAEVARDLEYIKEMTYGDTMEDRFFEYEASLVSESVYDYLEAKDMVDEMPDPKDDKKEQDQKEKEIKTIEESDHDLTFDEMIGI